LENQREVEAAGEDGAVGEDGLQWIGGMEGQGSGSYG
jgi:hypothetical protein